MWKIIILNINVGRWNTLWISVMETNQEHGVNIPKRVQRSRTKRLLTK
jgi:hypothetical protein